MKVGVWLGAERSSMCTDRSWGSSNRNNLNPAWERRSSDGTPAPSFSLSLKAKTPLLAFLPLQEHISYQIPLLRQVTFPLSLTSPGRWKFTLKMGLVL